MSRRWLIVDAMPSRLLHLAIVAWLALPSSATATQQVVDAVRYQGQDLWMDECPLSHLWSQLGLSPGFGPTVWSNNWKGYRAGWEVKDDRLYLTAFAAEVRGRPASVGDILPGYTLPVFADWYTGKIHIPIGSPGLAVYARIIVLEVEKGRVVGTSVTSGKLRPDIEDWVPPPPVGPADPGSVRDHLERLLAEVRPWLNGLLVGYPLLQLFTLVRCRKGVGRWAAWAGLVFAGLPTWFVLNSTGGNAYLAIVEHVPVAGIAPWPLVYLAVLAVGYEVNAVLLWWARCRALPAAAAVGHAPGPEGRPRHEGRLPRRPSVTLLLVLAGWCGWFLLLFALLGLLLMAGVAGFWDGFRR